MEPAMNFIYFYIRVALKGQNFIKYGTNSKLDLGILIG
jgi:hypothetical protein